MKSSGINNDLDNLKSFWKDSALKNRLQNHRCIAWRYFLGCFKPNSPMDSWSDQIIKDRKSYHLLEQQIQFNHQHSALDIDHPLSMETNSKWKSHFQNEELKKMIALDVDRTFPECAFFRERETQEALKNILFVFCKTKLSDQYRQGMHELLALIYLVLEQEYQLDSTIQLQLYPDLAFSIYDKSHIESDSFLFFEKVVSIVSPWYDINIPFIHHSDETQVGHHLHNELLQTIDPHLYHHLNILGMEPQYYTIKWLRLLFAREFSIRQVLFLWDIFFSSSNPRECIEYFALSLLLSKKTDLLKTKALHEAMPIMIRPYSMMNEDIDTTLSSTSSENMILYYVNKANILVQSYQKIKSHEKHTILPSCNTIDIFRILKSEIYDWLIEVSLQSTNTLTLDRNVLDTKKSILESILFSLAEM